MTLKQATGEMIIRFFIKPWWKRKKINFNQGLTSAKKMLILLPLSAKSEEAEKLKERLIGAFPAKKIFFANGPFSGSAKNSPGIRLDLGGSDASIWHLLRNHPPKSLPNDIDVFIDLDTELNILGAYLSRCLNPTISIAFRKQACNRYYNLVFAGQPQDLYYDRVLGLLKFLATLQ